MQINDLLEAAEQLATHHIQAEVVKLNVITPLDPEPVLRSVQKTGTLLVAEDCVASGSVGQRLSACLEENGISASCCLINCGDSFIHHGAVPLLKQELSLDGAGITKKALEVLGRG
jgi:1-deoxy-D-xylulose-5-phosphate synthase